MARDKTTLEIDSSYNLKDFNVLQSDTTALSQNRSDLKAIEKTMELNQFKIATEQSKLLPEFGIKYDHMLPLIIHNNLI
jgi:hypothetical protein